MDHSSPRYFMDEDKRSYRATERAPEPERPARSPMFGLPTFLPDLGSTEGWPAAASLGCERIGTTHQLRGHRQPATLAQHWGHRVDEMGPALCKGRVQRVGELFGGGSPACRDTHDRSKFDEIDCWSDQV